MKVPQDLGEDTGEGSGLDWARFSLLLALVVGALLRLLQFTFGRSLWLDEALMLPRILEPTLVELLDPGTWAVTPPGFLLLTRGVVELFGDGEHALRLLPLLAGLASLPLFLHVSRRLLSPRAVPLTLWIFSLAPFLVYYSSEVKQYSTDVLVTLLILWGATKVWEQGATSRRALAWGVGGTLAIFFSLTAVFVLAGATITLLAQFHGRGDRASVRRLMVPTLAWTGLFGAAYLLLLREVGVDGYMQTFWQSGFMPLPPRSLADLAWFPETLQRVFRDPLGVIGDRQIEKGFYQAAAGLVAFTVGTSVMWTRNRFGLLTLLLPVGLALIASGLRLYPFGGDWISGGRVILFLAPSFFLIMGEGAHHLLRKVRGLGIAVAVLLLAAPAAYALIAVPNGRVEVRPLLEEAAAQWRAGDVLYSHYAVNPALSYYAPRVGLRPHEVIPGRCARFEPNRYIEDLSQVRRARRVWVLFGTGRGAAELDEKGLMLAFLNHIGEPRGEMEAQGASLHLFEIRTGELAPYSASVRQPQFNPLEDCSLWD